VVALVLLVASLGVTVGSVSAGDATGTNATAQQAPATNETGADGQSASCSYRQTDTNLAYEGSTAGVLDPRSSDRLAVLLGGFTDTSPNYTAAQFEREFFGTGAGNARGPGTLRDYYLEATDGMINLSAGPAGVNGWYETNLESDQIGEEDGDFLDLTPNENSQFVRKVIEQADSDVDFSEYDNDGDGCIAVMVVYQGANIRAHASSPWGNFFKDADFSVDVDGVTVSAYARVAEEHTNGGKQTDNRETIGTPAHELGHLYGMPDLYKEGGGPNDDIGIWGLMASGNSGTRGGELFSSSPTHPSAWTKLQLFQRPAPGTAALDEYRVTIPRTDRPGILPPAATDHQYYRINPTSVSGCSACEGQYYLLGYRKQVGFDQGLGINLAGSPSVGSNDTLRITRVDGPWDGNLSNDPSLLHGANRLDGYGNESFNASSSSIARLADGSDSGIELENFSTEYGTATFNDPPERHLDADETAVFAVAVSQTLPDGTEVGEEFRLDNRVAINDSSANMTIEVEGQSSSFYGSPAGRDSASGQDFLRATASADGLDDGVVREGGKIIHTTDTSTDYISATTYPTYPLPTAMTAEVTEPWADFEAEESTVTVEVNVSATGEPYDYGEWGPPEASQFRVRIGGTEVATENLTITELDEHRYDVEAVVPVSEMEGYGLNVSFTGKKAGSGHTVRGTGNILTPTFETMAGRGIAADPYQVTSMVELQAADAKPDAYYKLTTDLDASESDDWFGGKGFVPIGETGEFPDGVNLTLDGNGHSIEDLTMDRPDRHSVGLFGAIGPDGTVEDLTVRNPRVRGDGSSGGAVGTLAAHNRGTIENVTVEGADIDENSDSAGTAGGLVGTNGQPLRGSAPETGTLRNVSVSGEVDGDGRVGGVLGINSYGGEIYDTHSSVRIDTGRDVGGLAGESLGPIVRSSATGDVESGGQYATGPAGGLVGESEGDIKQSYATGNVSGNREAGGLVGSLDTSSAEDIATISLSYATGDVDGEGKVGGLVGENNDGNITHSYAQGNVSGTRRVAGLVGASDDGYGAGFVEQSYATGRVSGDRFVEGLMQGRGTAVDSYWARDNIDREVDSFPTGQPVPREKMKGETAKENMTGFDFENTWTTVDGDYPQLQWDVDAQQADDPDDSDSDDTDTDDNDADDNDTDDSDTNGADSTSSDADSDDSTQGSDDTTGASGPGMGAPAAVVGLIVAALLLAQRNQD
jgi:M6 family metalloprotease-like protein/PGF-CTERM protein